MKIVNNFSVKVKPTKLMGEYIALHGLVPNNELPVHLRWKIPRDEIWIRRDIYDDKEQRKKTLEHEECELMLMTYQNLTYKRAHGRATRMEETRDWAVCTEST
jgi:hypothetical protein